MFFGLFFALLRFAEIVTLIPILGMLAYFVNIYASNNALTPTYILLLFIVSVLGSVWTIVTLFTYHRSKSNSVFVGLIDLCFFGALIAAVYELRGITNQNCTSVSAGEAYQIDFGAIGSVTVNGLHFSANKQCSMLKASFALGIMNVVFFFMTGALALFHGGWGDEKREVVIERSYVSSRHGSRRSGSHRSGRSSHSRRRAYV